MKRLLKPKLLLVLSALFLSLHIKAADFEYKGIYYDILPSTDLTVAVVSGEKTYSGEVVIPETVEYNNLIYKVVSIRASAFSECSGLTSIIMPSSITFIGINAFWGCSSLTSIQLPNISVIMAATFAECTGLTSITIPESVSKIESYAFYNCSSLVSFTIPNAVTMIQGGAFYECNNLKDFIIADGEKSIVISGSAFAGTHIESLYLGRNIENKYALVGQSELKTITIGNRVTAIPDTTFWCEDLKDIFVYASQPPFICETTFPPEVYRFATLHIPYDDLTGDWYTEGWKNFIYVLDDISLGVSSSYSADLRIYASSGSIIIDNALPGEQIAIYNTSGMLIKTLRITSCRMEVRLPSDRVYIVKSSGKTVRVSL